jgi:hypothetical protein
MTLLLLRVSNFLAAESIEKRLLVVLPPYFSSLCSFSLIEQLFKDNCKINFVSIHPVSQIYGTLQSCKTLPQFELGDSIIYCFSDLEVTVRRQSSSVLVRSNYS